MNRYLCQFIRAQYVYVLIVFTLMR
jgi:hypothetical protein